MIIYGRRPVYEFLRAGGKPKVIYLQKGAKFDEDLLELIAGHKVELVNSRELNKLTSVRDHQGIAADIGDFKTYDRKHIINVSLKTGKPVLVVDRIQDVRNLGALIRSAEAFGFAGVIIPPRRTAPITPAVVKTSAGAIFHIPIAVYNAAKFITEYKRRGGVAVGLDMAGKDITTTKIPTPVAAGGIGMFWIRLFAGRR